MFHSFFNSLTRYLSFFSVSFNFTLWSTGTAKFFFHFFIVIIKSGRLAEIKRTVGMSKSQGKLCVSFTRIDVGLCIYHLFVWSNLNFLHIYLWITLPTQPCLDLYSFCANLRHSFIMCLMVSSPSPHGLHLLFWFLWHSFMSLSEEIPFLF